MVRVITRQTVEWVETAGFLHTYLISWVSSSSLKRGRARSTGPLSVNKALAHIVLLLRSETSLSTSPGLSCYSNRACVLLVVAPNSRCCVISRLAPNQTVFALIKSGADAADWRPTPHFIGAASSATACAVTGVGSRAFSPTWLACFWWAKDLLVSVVISVTVLLFCHRDKESHEWQLWISRIDSYKETCVQECIIVKRKPAFLFHTAVRFIYIWLDYPQAIISDSTDGNDQTNKIFSVWLPDVNVHHTLRISLLCSPYIHHTKYSSPKVSI